MSHPDSLTEQRCLGCGTEPEPGPGLQDLLAQPVPALPHSPEELGWRGARLSAAEKCDAPGLSVNAK